LRDSVLVITLAGFAGPLAPKLLTRFAKYKMWYIRQQLKRLQRLKLIALREDHEGRIIAKLAPKGKAALERGELWQMNLKKPVKWDGLWRVVAFDVPTVKKVSREFLRQHLKALGFYHIQKSIFVCPYPCEEELCRVCKFYEIEKHVSLLLATSLGLHEKAVCYHFKLHP